MAIGHGRARIYTLQPHIHIHAISRARTHAHTHTHTQQVNVVVREPYGWGVLLAEGLQDRPLAHFAVANTIDKTKVFLSYDVLLARR